MPSTKHHRNNAVHSRSWRGKTSRDAADDALARILLKKRQICLYDLELARFWQEATGLLLEHCLVELGAVDVDSMLEALSERRRVISATARCEAV